MPSIHDSLFSAGVRAALKKAQVAERTLSKILGITQASLSAKMNGRTRWTLSQRALTLQFLDAFGVPLPGEKVCGWGAPGILLDGARRERELSRAELAAKAGISLSKLASLETGSEPSLRDAVAISRVLSYPIEALFPAAFVTAPAASSPDESKPPEPGPAEPPRQLSPEERSDAELDADLDFFVDKKSSFVNTGGRRQQ